MKCCQVSRRRTSSVLSSWVAEVEIWLSCAILSNDISIPRCTSTVFFVENKAELLSKMPFIWCISYFRWFVIFSQPQVRCPIVCLVHNSIVTHLEVVTSPFCCCTWWNRRRYYHESGGAPSEQRLGSDWVGYYNGAASHWTIWHHLATVSTIGKLFFGGGSFYP